MNRRSFLRSLAVAPLAVVPGVAAAQCGSAPKPEGYTEVSVPTVQLQENWDDVWQAVNIQPVWHLDYDEMEITHDGKMIYGRVKNADGTYSLRGEYADALLHLKVHR